MTASTLLLLVVFTAGAAFIQRTTGFGFGIFIMTMLPYLLPSYSEATTLSGLLAMVTSLMITIRYRRFIYWRRMLCVLCTFLMTSYVAVQLIAQLGNGTLHTILGVTLIAASLYFWFFSDKVHIRPNLPTQLSLGTLSGLMGGLFGMQGPPVVIYFLSVSATKEEYTAIAQAFFLIGNAVMTVYRAHAGFLSPEVWLSWCLALPAVFAGTWLGGLAFGRLSMPLLRRIVYLYIGISGIIALLG